jgi:hypothetical protein
MWRLSRNLGALNFWNPVGLFRPVMGQLYPYANLRIKPTSAFEDM